MLLGHLWFLHRASPHHHVVTPVIMDLVTGVLAGNGNGGDGDRKRCGCLNPRIFRITCDTPHLIGRSGRVEPMAYVLISRSS